MLFLSFIITDIVLILLSLVNVLGFATSSFDFLTRPISSNLKNLSSETSNFFSRYFQGSDLQAQNFDLRKQIISLKEQVSNYDEIKNQNDFLKKTNAANPNLMLSTVISINSNSTLLIDKGKNEGIKENDIVLVSPNTVFGRIIHVDQFVSTVEFVGETNSGSKGISVFSNKNGQEIKGFVSDTDDKTNITISDILKTNPLSAGDIFQTTGDDKIYPRGLVIGTVNKIDEKDTQSVKNANVVFDYNIDNTKYLYILKS